MSERIELRVIANVATRGENNTWNVDVSVGGRDGAVTLAADAQSHGGYRAIGDSIECWVSDTLWPMLIAFDSDTRTAIAGALVTVATRAILEAEAD